MGSKQQASKTTKNSAHTARGPRGLSSLCRPGSVPSYVNGFGGTLAVTSPVPYLSGPEGPEPALGRWSNRVKFSCQIEIKLFDKKSRHRKR